MLNGFEEFVKAAKELAKTLDDKRDVFAENAELAKGDMISVFCTVCGNKISLHEKLSEGYCEFCGEKIALKAALRGEMEKTAIENIDGKDLYELATKNSNPNMKLVEAAAKKGCVEANRMMAYHYLDEDNEKALIFARTGAQQGDLDCKCYEIALKGLLGKITDTKKGLEAIKKLDEYKKKGFATKEARHVCERTRDAIQNVFEEFCERERVKKAREEEELENYIRRQRIEEERKKRESTLPDFVVVPRIDVSDM